MTKNSTKSNGQSNQTPTYARIAIALLAFNFLLTGYCVVKMSNYTQVQIDVGEQAVANIVTTAVKAKASTATTEENE